MTSSATLSAKHNLKQCHIINLNLTNAQTLLSKKLTLTANSTPAERTLPNDKMSAEVFEDTDDEYISSKSVQKKIFAGSKTNSFESDKNNKNLMNFQTTLRTYCLSDCDYLNRQKKQRLKNFNAKIRHSIKNQMKKRQNDSKYLQNLEKSRESPESPEYQENSEVALEKSKTLQNLKEVNHVERRKSTNDHSKRKTSPAHETSKISPYAEAFKRIGPIQKETNPKDQEKLISLLKSAPENELSTTSNGKNPVKNFPSLFNKSSNHSTENNNNRPLSSKSMKILNSSRLDYSTVNINKATTGVSSSSATATVTEETEQFDQNIKLKTNATSSSLAHNKLASTRTHAATDVKNINNVLEIKQQNFTSKSLNKLESTSSNDKGLNKNSINLRVSQEDPSVKETLIKLRNLDVEANKSEIPRQIEYEILEELLVNELEDTHSLPNSINDLKIEFEKKLRAKKLLIQNLNFNKTIAKEVENLENSKISNSKILSSKKPAANAAKLTVSEHSNTTKPSGSSALTTNATRNGSNDFVKSQAVRKKLIFKRNFSDESDHNSKTSN